MYPSTTDLITRALIWHSHESPNASELTAYYTALIHAGISSDIRREIEEAIEKAGGPPAPDIEFD